MSMTNLGPHLSKRAPICQGDTCSLNVFGTSSEAPTSAVCGVQQKPEDDPQITFLIRVISQPRAALGVLIHSHPLLLKKFLPWNPQNLLTVNHPVLYRIIALRIGGG